jgi:hypothetical protein
VGAVEVHLEQQADAVLLGLPRRPAGDLAVGAVEAVDLAGDPEAAPHGFVGDGDGQRAGARLLYAAPGVAGHVPVAGRDQQVDWRGRPARVGRQVGVGVHEVNHSLQVAGRTVEVPRRCPILPARVVVDLPDARAPVVLPTRVDQPGAGGATPVEPGRVLREEAVDRAVNDLGLAADLRDAEARRPGVAP